MLKISAGLAWGLAILLEWIRAFGGEAGIPRAVEGALWAAVLLSHLRLVIFGSSRSERILTAISGALALGFVLGIKLEELLYASPLAYTQSRRAELLSIEWGGIPGPLLLTPLVLLPSAAVFESWLRGNADAGSLQALIARFAAGGYFGVTLLGCLRYGAGELIS